MSFLLGVAIFVVALLASIMLHEAGHFTTAKMFGMKATQFFVGFGRTVWSRQKGETEYGVKAIPAGGFVKIVGMTDLEDVDPADEPRSFRNQPGWQRIIVLAAGSFMHFVLALILLFALAIGIGQSNPNSTVISSITGCVPANASALSSNNPCGGHNLGKSPAKIAGLKPNDKIVSVAGKRISAWDQLHKVLKGQKAGVTIRMVVLRAGRDVRLSITPKAVPKWPVAC